MSSAGPECSQLAWGFWRLAEWEYSTQELRTNIETVLEAGVTTFDHADIYGGYRCEKLFGEVLGESPGLRERMELVTKCGIKTVSENRPEHGIPHYDSSRSHILDSVDRSLANLQTDYLDVLLLHRPDFLMDVDEVAAAFTKLRDSGKVRHFGVSNFSPEQYSLLDSRVDMPLVTNQVELSVMNMEVLSDGTLDQCQRLRISPMAWSPFAGGDLFSSDTARALRLRGALESVGDQLGGLSVDQVALAWITTHPVDPIVILGTGKVDRIERAVEACEVELSREQWYRIWTASKGHPVP